MACSVIGRVVREQAAWQCVVYACMFSIFVITGLSWNSQFQLCIICSCMHMQHLCSHRLITDQAVQQCIPTHVQHLCNHRLILDLVVEQGLASDCICSIFAITGWPQNKQLSNVLRQCACAASLQSQFDHRPSGWLMTLCLCACAASLRSSHSQGYCPLSTRSLWCASFQRRCRPTSTTWPCALTTMRSLTR